MKKLNTLFVGRKIYRLPVCPSTNVYAVHLIAKSNPAEGTAVLTYNQTAGRGQVGRNWESAPDKNVSLSVILYPKFLPVRTQFNLNVAVSLAIFDVVSEYAEGVKIKWPNDIYIGKKKVAGILMQTSLSGQKIANAVVGIGLNVNQEAFLSDAPNPVSLKNILGQDTDLDAVSEKICAALEARYLQLKSGDMAAMRREYILHLYKFGQPFTFQRPAGSYFTGIIRGISQEGKLVIETETDTEEFGMQEVKFCR